MDSSQAEASSIASELNKASSREQVMGRLAPDESDSCPPPIAPLSGDGARPFWSVMIPSYNPDPDYLAQTLKGVLAAGIGASEMQIEVVDNASTGGDVAALVRSIAGDRVSVYRHSQNLGMRRNWNSCIERARGEWVHILHSDDIVLPSFYKEMQLGLMENTGLGAAFCRHGHIRADGSPFYVSDLERETPGVLENWIQRLIVMQRIQPPSMTVRRAVYEQLGGFWSASGSCLDWEMWMRISAHYSVWYHPEILACYRVHGTSGTSALRQSASMTVDAGRAIEIAGTYLPAEQRDELVRMGKRHYARSAFGSAINLIKEGSIEAALNHLDEGLQLDPSPESVQLVEQIMAQMPTSALPNKSETVQEGEFFAADEALTLEQLIKSYQENPADASTAEGIRALRQGLFDFLSNAEPEGLEKLFQTNFGKIYRLLLKSGFQTEPLLEDERKIAESLADSLRDEHFDVRQLQAYMLYRLAHHGLVPFALERVPGWFLDEYLAYVLHSPQMFLEKGEAVQYCGHMLEWVRSIHRRTRSAPGAALTFRVAKFFTHHANFIPLYFVETSTKELLTKRASIIEFLLEKSGAALNFKFPPAPRNRSKIKIGFLNAHFGSQTETYSTLPSLSLDRSKFEICIFTLASGGGVLEDYCRAHADQFVKLPERLGDQVAAIRKAALDVIMVGTNVTAVTNQVSLLALHRLAPVQLLTNSAPVTSGMKHMDGYISGTLCDKPGAGEHYTEKLHFLNGPAHCFEYSIDAQPAQVSISRKQLGIPEDCIVFVSGANCFKILPELMETWAKILKSVEGSRLLLHPFNPNWSSAYPVRQFERSMAACFQRHGVDSNRLILSADRLPTRSDVKELMRVGDVYLDSYPFAGVNSTVDPLELGIPPVAWEGETFRSLMAGSLLRELQIPELIATGEESYIKIAVKLACDSSYRSRLREQITAKMARKPLFMDCVAYGKQVGDLIETLVPWPKNAEPKGQPPVSSTPRDSAPEEALIDIAIRLHTAGQLAQAEELYRQILTANPQNPDAWNLLGVLAHQCGNDESAIEFIEHALNFIPNNAVFWNNLAEACRTKGDNARAIECCRRALELQPDFAEVMVTLANALRDAGETGEAMHLFAKALQINPGYAEGLLQYGLALYGEKRFKEAVSFLKKACAAAPTSVEACYHLGVALEALERYLEALSCYEKASKLNADVGEVWNRWGRLLNRLKEYQKATVILQEALRCNSEDPDYNYNYGHALQMLQRSDEALAHFTRAIELGADTPELHNNSGIILKDKGRYFEAAESFHRALSLRPDMIPALNNLGAVCTDMGMTSEALECVQLLISKKPDLPSAHNNLGKLLKDSGRAAEALASYKRSIELNPDISDVHHNFLLCLNYLADRDPRESFNFHRAWGERVARKFRGRFEWRERIGSPDRKLRIGYVSADFCQHPVALFIEALFAKHDRQSFEVVAYSDVKSPDYVTERLQGMVDFWRTTRELNHREMAQMIWDDKIDILVDLSGHTAWNRLEMFALKPAPVQVSYLGYPATTGLPTVDYRITDHLADPAGTTDHLHTERLVRLPTCAWCYLAPENTPDVVVLPSMQTGYVTFGCFNQLAKLNPALMDLWVRILNRVPGSHLKLKAKTLHDPSVRRDLLKYFVDKGIEESRLEIVGFAPTQTGHLEAYQGVDIALDSYPYHGTTTTCEALWMGAPVVTLAGDIHVSRVGVSLLTAVGLDDLITSTPESYIETAVRLAEDRERLASLRAGMRTTMLASPLMDKAALASAMDDAFRQMWKEYVARQLSRK